MAIVLCRGKAAGVWCADVTFAEGGGHSEGGALSRQVDGAGADHGALLPVRQQSDPGKHRGTS